jgi:glycerol-3-phosphate acyltransferase PlsY
MYIAVVWFVVLGCTKTVGIATAAALIALPLSSAIIAHDPFWVLGLMVFIMLFGLWLHRNNIKSYFCMSA